MENEPLEEIPTLECARWTDPVYRSESMRLGKSRKVSTHAHPNGRVDEKGRGTFMLCHAPLRVKGEEVKP